MPTNIHELLGREITDDEIEVLVDKCSRGNTITIGAFEVLGADEMSTPGPVVAFDQCYNAEKRRRLRKERLHPQKVQPFFICKTS